MKKVGNEYMAFSGKREGTEAPSVTQPAVKGDGRAESGLEFGPASPVTERSESNRWRRRKPASLAPYKGPSRYASVSCEQQTSIRRIVAVPMP